MPCQDLAVAADIRSRAVDYKVSEKKGDLTGRPLT
jgi:hypothetical protein